MAPGTASFVKSVLSRLGRNPRGLQEALTQKTSPAPRTKRARPARKKRVLMEASPGVGGPGTDSEGRAPSGVPLDVRQVVNVSTDEMHRAIGEGKIRPTRVVRLETGADRPVPK